MKKTLFPTLLYVINIILLLNIILIIVPLALPLSFSGPLYNGSFASSSTQGGDELIHFFSKSKNSPSHPPKSPPSSSTVFLGHTSIQAAPSSYPGSDAEARIGAASPHSISSPHLPPSPQYPVSCPDVVLSNNCPHPPTTQFFTPQHSCFPPQTPILEKFSYLSNPDWTLFSGQSRGLVLQPP